MPHRDHEVGADEDQQLSELDRLGRVDVAGRAQGEEEGRAEALELRALVALEGILDGQLMQVELGRHRLQLVEGGPVEADPGDAAVRAGELVRLVEVDRVAEALAVDVDGAVDECHGIPFGQGVRCGWHGSRS